MKVTRSIFLILLIFSIFLFFPQSVGANSGCITGTCPGTAYGSWCHPPAPCPGDGVVPWCDCLVCPCAGCEGVQCWCCPCTSPPSCGGSCFIGETNIEVNDSKLGTKQIKDLNLGDIVKSFDPETGEITEGKVSDVTKTIKEGYYILETESGERVEVTGEHPFLVVGREITLADKVKKVLSHTLTYQLITSLQRKLVEISK
jgi:hypothetical protein